MVLRHALTAVAIATFTAAATLAQAGDPMLGTWKLNPAKSKTTHKSATTTIEAVGDALKVTANLEMQDGTKYQWSWTAKYDGKDAPVAGTTPFGSPAVANLTRVDARTVRVVGKVGGKEVVTQTITVAEDGRSRTVVTKGTDAKGQAVNTTAIYDKY